MFLTGFMTWYMWNHTVAAMESLSKQHPIGKQGGGPDINLLNRTRTCPQGAGYLWSEMTMCSRKAPLSSSLLSFAFLSRCVINCLIGLSVLDLTAVEQELIISLYLTHHQFTDYPHGFKAAYSLKCNIFRQGMVIIVQYSERN